jgi:hypothetical protein
MIVSKACKMKYSLRNDCDVRISLELGVFLHLERAPGKFTPEMHHDGINQSNFCGAARRVCRLS